MKNISHKEYYRQNIDYLRMLSRIDLNLYNKYLEFMSNNEPGAVILDVGCGIGTVVNEPTKLNEGKYIGVDVSEIFINRAKKGDGVFELFDGEKLPFKNNSFDKVGAFTVLEHTEDPVRLIYEMVRIVKKGGKIIISCPNFLRVVGLHSDHPKTNGLINPLINLLNLIRKYIYSYFAPDWMNFEKMLPILSTPFKADYDAIIATNPIDVRFF